MIQPTFQVNVPAFDRRMAEFQTVSGMEFLDAIKMQTRLLGAEIAKRTPPMSGKDVKRMLAARGTSIGWRDAEIESMTARKVGERRVEKDIGKVIFGLKSDEQKAASRGVNLGRIQKVQGRVAVRLFADRNGKVYGTDAAMFQPRATDQQMKAAHYAARTKRGRVSRAGQATLDVGRWRWIDLMVVKDLAKKRYIRLKQKMVGQAKGGWVSSLNALGANISISGWIGRHFRSGTYRDNLKPNTDRPSFTFINKSQWAKAGDPDRIIQKSMEGRARAMAGDIERRLKEKWRALRRAA